MIRASASCYLLLSVFVANATRAETFFEVSEDALKITIVTPQLEAVILYRATEQHDQVWQSGPEYQILDNARHLDGLNKLASAGACYAVFAPSRDATRPLGQWNQTRILARGKHVEHWLNGEKLLEYDIDSDRWQAHVKTSKFFPTAYGQGNWGQATKGHIGLQDHGGAIEFRNIKIRPLAATGK